MHRTTKHCALTTTALLTAVTFFCIPLILRYRIYKDYSISLTATDTLTVNKWISPIWCASQHLHTNNLTFSAFMVPSKPKFSSERRQITFKDHLVLPAGTVESWGFHLLKGSTLTVSLCARMAGGKISIIKGRSILTECLRKHVIKAGASSESLESPESEDESHESTVSSSEGVFSNETSSSEEFDCELASNHRTIPPSLSCSKSNQNKNMSLIYDEQIHFKASATDHYYVVFSSTSYLQLLPNEFFVSIQLQRVVFDVTGSYQNYTDIKDCDFKFAINKKGFLVVEMGPEYSHVTANDLSLTHDVLKSVCVPRKGLYFIFYLLMFAIIFICAFQ